MSKFSPTLQAAAEASNLPLQSLDQARMRMALNLLEFHGHNTADPELRSRFHSAYEHFAGIPLDDLVFTGNPESVAQPHLLMGPPGGGKTSATLEAARLVAGLVNMNFVVDPGPDQPVGKNDYLFINAGFIEAESPITALGIPTPERAAAADGSPIKYQGVLREISQLQLANCPAGFLFIDDLPSAAPSIQNLLLRALHHPAGRNLGNLKIPNVFVAGAGNLGTLDGTHTFELSKALEGRTRMTLVDDVVDDWIARTSKQFARSKVGLAHMDTFLLMNPDMFRHADTGADSEPTGPQANSRTISAATQELVKILYRHQALERAKGDTPAGQRSPFEAGLGGDAGLVAEIQTEMHARCGRTFARKFTEHFVEMNDNVHVLVKQLVADGKLNPDNLKTFIERSGRDQAVLLSDHRDFQRRFCYLASQLIQKEIEKKPGDKQHQERMVNLFLEASFGPTNAPGSAKISLTDSTVLAIGWVHFAKGLQGSSDKSITVTYAPDGTNADKLSAAQRSVLKTTFSVDFLDRISDVVMEWAKKNPQHVSTNPAMVNKTMLRHVIEAFQPSTTAHWKPDAGRAAEHQKHVAAATAPPPA